MYLIDSNIFLELVFEQDRSIECKAFLQKVKSGEINSAISDFNIDSILLAIYRQTKNALLMETFLTSVLRFTGLDVYFLSMEDRLEGIKHIKTHSLDFEDALTLQAALASSCSAIVSFDRDFDNLPVKRVEPMDIL